MKIIQIAFCLLVLTFVAHAQDFEYGKPVELKGLTKIFVDTGANLDDRERIIKELEKAKLGIELLDSSDDAEIILLFRGRTDEKVTGAVNTQHATVIQTDELASGSGIVFIKGANKPRIILSVSNSQQSRLEKRPVTKFVKAFVKIYKTANGIKQ